MSRTAAGELIDGRVAAVSQQARISAATARRYLTHEAIKGLAQSLTFEFVEETPGADLFSAPRDTQVPVRLVGRVAAGLAEAVKVRLMEREDLEYTREVVAQLAHSLSVLGLITADQVAQTIGGEPVIQVPRALARRLARYLEVAADLCDDGVVGFDGDQGQSSVLAAAMRRDSGLLRAVSTH